jgi:hypothetical protein
LPEKETQMYQWYRAENEDGEKVLVEGATGLSYATNNTGFYYLKVLNTRNGTTVEGINNTPIRVTLPATAPYDFDYKSGPYEVSDTLEISPSLGLTVIPFADRVDSFKYQWYSESKPNVIIGVENTILPKFAAGTVIYCKVASVYNGDVSDFVETAKFTVVGVN